VERVRYSRVVVFLLAAAAAWTGATLALAGSGPAVRITLQTAPYTVQDAEFEAAFGLAAEGKFAEAAARLAKARSVPEESVRFLVARCWRLASDVRKYEKALLTVARGAGKLAPLSALELGEHYEQAGRTDQAEEMFGIAREVRWLAPRALAGIARIKEKRKDFEGAIEALNRALPAVPLGEARDGLLLLHARLMEKVGRADRAREVLRELYLYSEGYSAAVTARLKRLEGKDFRVLELIRLLLRESTSAWSRELAPLAKKKKKKDPWLLYKEAILAGAVDREYRRKEEALAHFEEALSAARTVRQKALAMYMKGRALEGLDRDLEAREDYDALRELDPGFPLDHPLLVRLATLSVREGLPLHGASYLERFFERAFPGERLCDALWLDGFLGFLAARTDAALASLTRLGDLCSGVERSAFERYGTMALYWKARTLAVAGSRGAATDILAMLGAGAGDYYGPMALGRLAEMGAAAPEAWLPSRMAVSPLEVPNSALVAPQLAAGVELYRLGLWEEAFQELRLASAGVEAGDAAFGLMASAWMRAGLSDAARLRRLAGGLPAPWTTGARLWRGLAKLAFAGPLAEASDEAGLPRALAASIVRFESNYQPDVVSKADAVGLFQVKTSTGTDVSVHCLKEPPVRARQLKDPGYNLRLGAMYVAGLLVRHHGNWAVALAAYNAGPGTASWWLSRFAGLSGDELLEQVTYPNTVGYVKRIVGMVPVYWSLHYPVLGGEAPEVSLAPALPDVLGPFFGDSQQACPVARAAAAGEGGR